MLNSIFKKIIFCLIIINLFAKCSNKKNNYRFNEYLNSNLYNSLDSKEKETKLDSLYSLINEIKNDSLKNELLFKISEEYYYLGNNTKSRNLSKLNLSISKSLNDSVKMAKSFYYLGDTYESTKKDSAYYYYSLARKIYHNDKDYGNEAKMQFYKAYLLFYDSNYIDCEARLIEALRLNEKTENFVNEYSYLNLMGICQEKLKNYDLSLSYHQKAIKVLDNIEKNDNNLKYRIASIINICNLYEFNADYDKVIKELSNLLISYDIKRKQPEQYAIIINNIAYAKMKKGDFKGVENKFLEALKISEEINNNNEILYRKVNLGEFYLTVGSINKSEVYLKDALDLSKRIGNYNEYLKSLKFLAKVDLQNKDFYNDEYVRVKDSLTTAQLTNREKYARIEYETTKLEEENEKLTQQNLIILLASLFVTALFILIVLYTRLNSQKKENKLLNDKQKAESEMITLLEESRKNIENTKINEQNRISKELHDGVLNDLYGIRLNLDFMVSSLDNELSIETETYIDSLLKVEDDIRKISHDLKIEEKFEKSEFKNLIYSLVEEKNELQKINFKCEIDDKIDWSIFTTSNKLNIYRIIQEATQNVIKHSNASNCDVSFNLLNESLVIVIEDNGVGFQLENDKDGIGLKNIKERVEELKGKITFEESLNGGSKIILKIKK